jgi:hypothetical protein
VNALLQAQALACPRTAEPPPTRCSTVNRGCWLPISPPRCGYSVAVRQIMLFLGPLLFLACGAAPCPDVSSRAMLAPSSAPESSPAAPPDLPRWRAIKAAGGALPSGAQAVDELPALIELLGSPNPEARDSIAYEIIVKWAGDESMFDQSAVRELARMLRAKLTVSIAAGESDATFARSFAALALSMVAARDVRQPTLSDEGLFALVDDIQWYAAHEVDLRGHTGARGWLHAAAHTADVLKFLARNPRITASPSRTSQLLDAVASLVVRRHGYLLHHGEDARLAAPVLELLARDAVDLARFESWVAEILEPLRQPSGEFEPALYAAQRNARNLLFTLVASFELREETSESMLRARDALLTALRGG